MNETWNGKEQKITHTMKVEMEKEIPSQACEERIHSRILEMYEQRKRENLKMEKESGMKDRAENRICRKWQQQRHFVLFLAVERFLPVERSQESSWGAVQAEITGNIRISEKRKRRQGCSSIHRRASLTVIQ